MAVSYSRIRKWRWGLPAAGVSFPFTVLAAEPCRAMHDRQSVGMESEFLAGVNPSFACEKHHLSAGSLSMFIGKK